MEHYYQTLNQAETLRVKNEYFYKISLTYIEYWVSAI